MELTTPEAFLTALQAEFGRNQPPWKKGAKEWTSWFGKLMQNLVQSPDYCWNLQHPDEASECMQVDHVLMSGTGFKKFPLVVVEHENRGLGTKDGIMPDVGKGAFIEWAFWKTLVLRSHLGVLVAYPDLRKKDDALNVLAEIATTFEKEYDSTPNSLLLLCWWDNAKDAPADRKQLYTPYVLERTEQGFQFLEINES